jgi:hypothetical protein
MTRLALPALAASLLLALPAGAQPAPPGPGAPSAETTPRAAAPRAAGAPQQRRTPRSTAPTDQLFEAINEGEMEDVRAAVAAGADIGARNILGLTPVDLAIDLGRNDVALYLLSLGRVRDRPLGVGAAPEPAEPRRRQAPQPQAAPRAPAAPVSGQGIVAVAPLWRGDGGTPNPEAGFLGFDAVRPPGATPTAAQRQAPAPRTTPAQRAPVAREALPPG